MATEEIQALAKQNIGRKDIIVELRARRLDQADACNITNPILPMSMTDSDVDKSLLISPTGCHYSMDHYKNFSESGNGYSADEIFKMLSRIPPYNGMTSEIQEILKNNNVDLSEEALMNWAKANDLPTSSGVNTVVTNTTNDQNPSKEQLEQAKQQRKEEPTDLFSTKISSDSAPTTFNEKDYTEWLCELYNGACRKSTLKPAIPTSVAVSIALAMTGCTNTNIGKFNFWKLPYNSELTSLSADKDNMCAFGSADAAANACLTFAHASNIKDAISGLKDKMSESSEEEKQEATKNLIQRIDMYASDDKNKAALEFVSKYSLRDWDTDKTVAEGGHADQTTTTNSKTDSNGSGLQDKVAKALDRVQGLVGDKGVGFTIKPIGSDHVEIIKLPMGKTPAEPIYPDYITVGDTVPEWVYSDTYAAIAEELQKKALAKVGITLEEEESNSEIQAFNQELQNFKDRQFAQWCRDNNISYEDEAGKNEALAKYTEASKTDADKFKDGIYIPDISTQSTYDALLAKKNSILSSGSVTAQQYQSYQNATQSVKSEIQAREGGWNQDSGTYTPGQNSNGGSTQESGALPSNNSSNPVSTQTSTETPKNTSISVKIEKMVQFAESKVGGSYSQEESKRNGPNSYDCSSLVYWSLDAAGFPIISAWQKNPAYQSRYQGQQQVGDADTIWQDIQTMGATGWTKYTYSQVSGQLQRGDIVAYWQSDGNEGHTYIMTDANSTVEAKSTADGICKSNKRASYDIQEVYRYSEG